MPETENIEPAVETKDDGEKKGINWFAELRGLALMLIAVLAFHTLIAKPFYIPSTSMEPNLLVGDRLVVSKYPYGWSWVSASLPFHILPRASWRIAPKTPEYGDIVIVVPPDETEDYIKRVIGLPGDTIAVQDGQVFLNGKPVPREVVPPKRIPVADQQLCDAGYGQKRPCLEDFDQFRVRLPSGREVYEPPTFRETLPNGVSYNVIDFERQFTDNFAPVKVPPGHVFLMGDNRDRSADSRVDAGPGGNGLGGPVPISSVGGRAEFITFSLDGSMSWNPRTWLGAFRSGRAWTTLRPAKPARGDGRN